MIRIPGDLPLAAAVRAMAAGAAESASAPLGLVVDTDGRLVGTLSDGDVRRHLAGDGDLDAPVSTAMQADPVTFPTGTPLDAVLRGLGPALAQRGRRARGFLDRVVLVDADGRPTEVLDLHRLLELRVAVHRHVVVVGLGYVGLTLALVMADLGLRVTGVDRSDSVVRGLRAGRSHVHEPGIDDLLRRCLDRDLSIATELPEDGDVFVIAVGTPVVVADGGHRPDLTALHAATEAVAARLRPGGLVVLRSTVPIGTTRDVVAPRLAAGSGLEPGTGFHLAFAPERTTEGAALRELRTLPQIVGGITSDSVESTAALFREIAPTIVRTTTPEVAELAKLVNNSYRDLTFSFANEVARIGDGLGVDAIESIRVANQGYPRGQVPVPSPGVGGPCLTKDPYILADALPDPERRLSVITAGRAVNERMPAVVADRVLATLREAGVTAGARILVLGAAFKGDPPTDDLRDSPSLEVIRHLEAAGADVRCSDRVIGADELVAAGLRPAGDDLRAAAAGTHALLILNDHRDHRDLPLADLAAAMADPRLLFDGWGLYRAADVLAEGFGRYLAYGLRAAAPVRSRA